MLLASKAAYAGIVFILLTTWISGPSPKAIRLGTDLSDKMADVSRPNDLNADDINKMQQTLQDKGHYPGKVDGRLGLRTRAGIRDYQKAENLPVTGQLDTGTAGRLGVGPEIRGETAYGITHDKPSAGIGWTMGLRRTIKTRRRCVMNKNGIASESAKGDTEKTLHTRNDKQPQ